MSSTRSFLLLALLAISYMLYSAWEQDYGLKPAAPTPAAATGSSATPATAAAGNDVPAAATPANAVSTPSAADAGKEPAVQTISVATDVLHVEISTLGGSVVRADLLAYPIDPKDKTKPVRLLDDGNAHYFVAQTGLVSSSGAAPSHKTPFNAEKTNYDLAAGTDKIEVPLTWTDASGISVRKVFVFTRGSYLIETREEVANTGTAAWTGNEYRQLQRTAPPAQSGGLFSVYNSEAYAFVGAAWYAQGKFNKLAFAKFSESPLNNTEVSGGWVALLQHYFFAAFIPTTGEADQYSTSVLQDHYLIRALSPALTVAPNATGTFATRLYVGPKLQSELANVAPGLELTADYGILTFIAQPMHWVLVQLHKLTGNWGVAIILLVLLLKLALYKPSEAQYRSMAKMKQFQPRLEALKERYGDDKQKLNAATMELYKKEKINPLGGCLPILIQMPIFFALLWVLQESVELRQAPFFGWIQNLSAPDPLFILPILNGVAMLATQWLSPASPGMDPMQQRMMKFMPLIFAVMFAFAPAGLTLYWTVNGWLSLLQQWIITKRVGAATTAPAKA
ncbi:membrane protein insertase YidC [Rudaea cellulosilytica]|uniref:membrane protein insertase YidC n=1 Tax=Rudaea cellulosilytica TaxID=540746 RepID=UPI0003715A57|nr:membrane protein insertase YidC [Rudaea cellulosilytica]